MPLSGHFDDKRPWFALAVTGHPYAVPEDGWAASVVRRAAFDRPGAVEVRRYLDDVLWRKRETHRLCVYCRDGGAGIDELVRAYCEARKLPCLPVAAERDVWGACAEYRRDLLLLARSAAVVWFGPRGTERPDLVTLAAFHGVEYRVVPLTTPEGVCDG